MSEIVAAALQRIEDLVEQSLCLDLHPLWDAQLTHNLRSIRRTATAIKRDLEETPRDSR